MKTRFYRAIAAVLVPLLVAEPAFPALNSWPQIASKLADSPRSPFEEQAFQEWLLNFPIIPRLLQKRTTTSGLLKKDLLRARAPEEQIDLNDFQVDDTLGQGIPVQLVVKASESGEADLRKRWLLGYKTGGFRMHRPRTAKMGFAGTAVVGQHLDSIEDPNVSWRHHFHDPKGIAVNDRLTVVAGSETLYVHDSSTGELIREIHDHRFKDLHSIQFSPFRPNRLLVASTGMELVLECNVNTGKVTVEWDPWKNGLNQASDGTALTEEERHDGHGPMGLPFEKLSHLNTASYDPKNPDTIYVVRFGPGEVLAVNHRNGKFRRIITGLNKPHGFTKTSEGWVVTDTFGGQVRFFDEQFRPTYVVDFRALPSHEDIAGVEWLQYTHELAPGVFATIDATRNGIWLFNLRARTKRFLQLNPDWMVQELVLDRSSPWEKLADVNALDSPRRTREGITGEVIKLEGLRFLRLHVDDPKAVNVLVVEPVKPKIFVDFQRKYPFVNFDVIRTESEVVSEAGKLKPGISGKLETLVKGQHYDYVFGYLNEIFDAAFFAAAKLRGLILLSTGIHNIDVDAATAHQTVVTHAPGPTTGPVAEQLIALALDTFYGPSVSEQKSNGAQRLTEIPPTHWSPTPVAQIMWYCLMRKILKLDELFEFGSSDRYVRLGVGRKATVYHGKIGQHQADKVKASIGVIGLDEAGLQIAEIALAHEIPIVYVLSEELTPEKRTRLEQTLEQVKATSQTQSLTLELRPVTLERLLKDASHILRTPAGYLQISDEHLSDADIDANELYISHGRGLSLHTSLSGSTVGIFGLGRIGEAAAQRFLSLGANVLINQRGAERPEYVRKRDRLLQFAASRERIYLQKLRVEYVGKDDFLARCNMIALSAEHTSETKGWVDYAALQKFGTKAYGPRALLSITQNLIDEDDLIRFLREHPEVEVRLDVARDEHTGSAFRRFVDAEGRPFPHLKLTGHTAAAVFDMRYAKVEIALYKNLLKLIRGEPPANPLNQLRATPKPALLPEWTPPATLTPEDIDDGQKYQAALYKGGDLTKPAHWHERAMMIVRKLIMPHIKNGDRGADFSTGTGGSAIELKKEPSFQSGITARFRSLFAGYGWKKKSFRLDLFDVLDSWFYQAHIVFRDQQDISFFYTWNKPKQEWHTLDHFRGRGAYDFVMSVSTLHLIPSQWIADAIQGIADGLKESGYFVWASGDIPLMDGQRVPGTVYLHDPFRFAREKVLEHIANDPEFKEEREFIKQKGADKLAEKANNIFLSHPPTLDVVKDALKVAGFVGNIFTEIISFTEEEAVQFIMVPRLMGYMKSSGKPGSTGYFPEIPDLAKRQTLVEKVMREEVLPKLPRDPKNPKAYLTYWTFGVFQKRTKSPDVQTPKAFEQAA